MVAPKEQKNNWSFRDAMKKKFAGEWLVFGCETDEFCSIAQGDLQSREYVEGFYGQGTWGVYKIGSSSPPRK